MYICVCHAVTESDIDRAIDEGAVTLDQLRDRLRVGTGCGSCAAWIEEMLEARLVMDGLSGPDILPV